MLERGNSKGRKHLRIKHCQHQHLAIAVLPKYENHLCQFAKEKYNTHTPKIHTHSKQK